MSVAVGRGEPLLDDNNAADWDHECKSDEREQFLSKGDPTEGSDHLYVSKSQ